MAELLVPFYSEAIGWTVTIGGIVYRPAIIDSDGHLQVDVLTSGLPTGAATAARQDTMITALQLIDDIRAALDSVNTDRLISTLDVPASDIRLANENYSTAQTNNELIAAPGAGKVIYVTGIFFSTDTAGNFKLTQSSGTPADVFGPHYFPANGGISAATLSAPIVLNANSALRVTTSITGNHTVTVLAKVV